MTLAIKIVGFPTQLLQKEHSGHSLRNKMEPVSSLRQGLGLAVHRPTPIAQNSPAAQKIATERINDSSKYIN